MNNAQKTIPNFHSPEGRKKQKERVNETRKSKDDRQALKRKHEAVRRWARVNNEWGASEQG